MKLSLIKTAFRVAAVAFICLSLAFALLNALDESQRKQAILNSRVDDLVTGTGHAGETIQSEGLKAAAMNKKGRAMLLDVIRSGPAS